MFVGMSQPTMVSRRQRIRSRVDPARDWNHLGRTPPPHTHRRLLTAVLRASIKGAGMSQVRENLSRLDEPLSQDAPARRTAGIPLRVIRISSPPLSLVA